MFMGQTIVHYGLKVMINVIGQKFALEYYYYYYTRLTASFPGQPG